MRKNLMSKYLLCTGAAGALALAPLAASAQEMTTGTTSTTTTDMANTMTPAMTTTTTMSAEPMLVSGTVTRYYVDRTGYVTAMEVQTTNGAQFVTFPANRGARIYNMYPAGGNIDVWVTPGAGAGWWNAVGAGTNRPSVWWQTFGSSDIDWLKAEPYFDAGAKQTSLHGTLDGFVTDDGGEILALIVDTGNGRALVRVPPQVRQGAPGHAGDERTAALFKGAAIDVIGTPEAVRRGGMLGTYNWVLAANSLAVNGKNVGAIGIRKMAMASMDTLLDDDDNMSEGERSARRMGYHMYVPAGTSSPGMDNSMSGGATTGASTTTSSTEMATGRVMVVGADGTTMMPVVRKSGKLYVQAADGALTQIDRQDGKYVVPASMTGSRMKMVMSDGRQMDMDTVNGQLMVIMADGSMAPVTLHTP